MRSMRSGYTPPPSLLIIALIIISCAFLLTCENPLIQEIWDLRTITFDTGGGSHVPSQKLLKGYRIERPSDPVWIGHDFIGWYEDYAGTTLWDFEKVPDGSMTLYAKWGTATPIEIVLIVVGLDSNDSVSFSDSTSKLSDSAYNGETVNIYYELKDTATINILTLDIGSKNLLTVNTAATQTYTYTVSYSDIGADGRITITAKSEHTNLTPQSITKSTLFSHTLFVVGATITSTDGTYTANDGGAAGSHKYQWYRADTDSDSTKIAISGATGKDYTTTSDDFGKYIWLETTPVGSAGLQGVAVQSDKKQIGIQLVTTVVGGAQNDYAYLGQDGITTANLYYDTSAITIRAIKGDSSTGKVISWSVNPNEGTIANPASENTTYTPPSSPSNGIYTLTATISDPVPTVFVYNTSDVLQDEFITLAAALDSQANGGYNRNGTWIIKITADQQLRGITLVANASITLVGDNTERKIWLYDDIESDYGDAMFIINASNSSLTIDNNITLVGLTKNQNGSTRDNDDSVIRIQNGTFTMNSGSKITGNTSDSSNNLYAAVYVTGTNSKFTMHGGTITGNKATDTGAGVVGGVFSRGFGTVELFGGSITGNTGADENRDVRIDSESTGYKSNGVLLTNNATIGTLILTTLTTNNNSFARVDSNNWTGKVECLCLYESVNNGSINNWIPSANGLIRHVADNTDITQEDINKFETLGKYIYNNGSLDISSGYKINIDNNGRGVLATIP